MISRREGLIRVALGMLASCWAFISCAPWRRNSRASTVGQTNAKSLAEALERDLSRLSQRAYSEQGIPVFLVCENLVSGDTPRGTGFDDGRESAGLAKDFRMHAETFQQIHPDGKKEDVAKLIEVLAERDFGTTMGRTTP